MNLIRAIRTWIWGFPQNEKSDPEPIGAWFMEGNITCPDCDGALLAGPRGGMATNCLCSACFAEFNVAGPFSKRMAEPGRGRKSIYGVAP